MQTPTLALIVERQNAIDDFVSSTYWELKTTYRDTLFSCTKGKISEKEKGEGYIESIKESDFIVDSYTQKEGKEQPPRLFDLTSLQVECNKKFGTSAEDTLNTIQKLYEKKLVTYPRVDTTYLSDDIYPKIPDILSKLTYYKRFTEKLLDRKFESLRKYLITRK